jgi:hypothetical protein
MVVTLWGLYLPKQQKKLKIMNFNRTKVVKNDTDKFINVPINMQWDFMRRDDGITEYEKDIVSQVIGNPQDFEIIRFAHNVFSNQDSHINYTFNFYDYLQPISATTIPITAWEPNYLNNGFSIQDVYYFSKSFVNSFFKLDFYDSPEDATQTLYLSMILPVQQGLTQSQILSTTLPPVQIKKPEMILDYIGNDKEGFFIYWLRNKNFIDVSTFYMKAKFFDAITGVYKEMTNTKQDLLTPSKFTFDHTKYYYYQVKLNYNTKTYEVYSTLTNSRVGDLNTPIIWYEYVNP